MNEVNAKRPIPTKTRRLIRTTCVYMEKEIEEYGKRPAKETCKRDIHMNEQRGIKYVHRDLYAKGLTKETCERDLQKKHAHE